MEELKDFIHLYLGCECKVEGVEEKLILTGVSYDDTQMVHWGYFENTDLGYAPITEIKIVLRPLGDMTKEEHARWQMGVKSYQSYALRIKFFLDAELDLFGLIDAGLAIDKTKTP